MHPSRRGFLELAGLGLAGAAVGAASGAPRARNLIVMYQYGGWDVAVGLDPKVGLPTVSTPPGEVGVVGNIDFFASDATPSVRAYFERHGAVSAVLRGIDMRSLSHFVCVRYALAGTSAVEAPDLGAIAGASLSPDRPLPYLVLGDRALTGPLAGSAGRVGLNNQLGALLDPARGYPPLDRAPPVGPDDEALVQSWLRGRVDRWKPQFAVDGATAAHLEDYLRSLDRGNLLYEHAAAFTGEATLEDQVDLAVYALSHEMSRAALVDSRMNWDTHILVEQQLGFHEAFFATLDHLMTSLADTPGAGPGATLLDETLVVCLSEMARTPRMNDVGGKEHWPYTAALVAGGPVRGDRVFGATDDALVAQPVDLATGEVDPDGEVLGPAQLVAGLLDAVGVDTAPWLPGVTPYRGPFRG